MSRVFRQLPITVGLATLVLAVCARVGLANDEGSVYGFPSVTAAHAPQGALETATPEGVLPTAALETVTEDGLLVEPSVPGVADVSSEPLVVRDEDELFDSGPWDWQVLPSGLIYRSYLAGVKESRIGCTWAYERDWGWMWDITLGGRVGLLRYGNRNALMPQGFQIDMEAAGQPRLDIEHMEDVLAADFRFGVPITYGIGRFQTKLAAYHLSSHLGDEYMIRLHSFDRINYSRNVLVWGNSYYWTDAIRLYGEGGWGFYGDGGSEPWEFQFGVEYAPLRPTGKRPVPFVALNSHLRQEVNYGGNMVVQTGCAWRGERGQMFRLGMQYYTGKSDQGEFYNQFEDKLGLGIWYDY